jgi:serine protease DegQ
MSCALGHGADLARCGVELWLDILAGRHRGLALLFVVATLKPEWLPAGASGPRPAAAGTHLRAAGAGSAGLGVGCGAATAAWRRPRAAPRRRWSASWPARPTRAQPARRRPALPLLLRRRQPQGGQPQTGLGSGVIVSPEGYLLTNNHVVEGADEIEVQLADGRQARRGDRHRPRDRPGGAEDRPRRLPAIAFGDSALQVGDPVLAIGNPFNVGQTVTSASSARWAATGWHLSPSRTSSRPTPPSTPATRAARWSTPGHLVGINTAIFSRSGGSMGIGFAIPTDVARR